MVPVIGGDLAKWMEKGIEKGDSEGAITDILESVQKEKKKINIKKVEFLEEFQSRFENIINKHFKGKKAVIFIDDLDRCLPKKALEVLDAIKLFLDVKGCIFVLGIDRRVISHIVREKYKKLIEQEVEKDDGILLTGENYIEKLIQLSFQLPPIGLDDVEKFIKSLEGIDSKFYEPYLPMIKKGIDPNPRKIKRFFNLIELQRNLFEKLQENRPEKERVIFNALMIEWAIISSNHPKFRDTVIKKNSVLVGMHEYIGAEKPGEPSEDLKPFLTNERLKNLIIEFKEYIKEQAKRLELNELLEEKFDDIIREVIYIGHATGIEKIEEKEVEIKEIEKGTLEHKEIEKDKEIEKAIEEKRSLIGADLSGCNLEMKNLSGMKLNGADLTNANLRKANLIGTNLNSAKLDNADLTHATLNDAKLVRAKLNSAILNFSNLENAKLNNAKLWHSQLKGANLRNVKLEDAELYNSNLSGADLTGAFLYNAGLMSVNLEKTKLRGADLRHCNLKNAKFDNGTDLRGAIIDSVTIDNLKGSNWEEANWDNNKLKEIREEIERKGSV